MRGVSVIIRSHDGVARLPATMAHLKAQVPMRTPWEVLLIDSAPTEETSRVAQSCWQNGPVPLRIVKERRRDLQAAAERGLEEAEYDFLGFVGDDNWLAPDWVFTAYQALAGDPALGAVGSICDPIFEESAPDWFKDFHSSYSIFTDSDLKRERNLQYLQGSGLCLRKHAWIQLLQGGFRPLVTDRIVERWPGTEDIELTAAIRLAGWKIRVDPRLRLRRPLPAQNLRWGYLRKLQRGHGASRVWLDAYSTHNLSMRLGIKPRVGELWWCQIARSLLRLMRRPQTVIAAIISNGEGRRDILEIEGIFGRALGVFRTRAKYGWSRRHVRYAPWRLRRPEEYIRRPEAVHA